MTGNNNQTGAATSRQARTMLLVITAMMTAMVMVSTTFFKIPNAVGYVHLGDGLVLLSAIILPRKHACFAGGVGAALADIYGGYIVWAPWTLFIKMIMVIFAQLLFTYLIKRKAQGGSPVKVAGFPLAELIAYAIAMVWTAAAYYVAQGFIYGNWIAPFADIPGNLLQAGVGSLVAVAVSTALGRTSLGDSFYYNRSKI